MAASTQAAATATLSRTIVSPARVLIA